MGLFGRRRKDGVRGTARVVSTNHAPHATHGTLTMTVVVEAPGIPAYSHNLSKFAARVDKWPSPGDVLPVSVDPDDPERVEVVWDEVPSVRETARQESEQLAAMLRQQQAGTAPPTPGMPTMPDDPGVTMVPGMDVPGIADMVGQLQQMFPGAVVNVKGAPAGTTVPPPTPATPATPPPPPVPPTTAGPPVTVVASQSGADPVERLEKLARLRDAGVVDQAQFEQLRAQILRQAGLDGN